MKPEIKKLWLDALSSGKYIHGTNSLRTQDSNGNVCFCVLGVLCDLHAKQTNCEWSDEGVTVRTPDNGSFTEYSYLGQYGILPKAVQEWSGIQLSSPIVGPGSIFEDKCLAGINDESYSYEDSIKAIEDYL